jgi:hypothetical protein
VEAGGCGIPVPEAGSAGREAARRAQPAAHRLR